jgi:hypothetical protein
MGATAGTKGLGVFTEVHVRRDVRPINQTSDIDGAQGGSLKKGTTTNRHLSPLDPQYQFPGHSELVDPSNAFSKSKTDFRGSKTFAPGTTSGSIHATTGLEALKRQSGALEVIPEKSPDLEVNKLYQASRGPATTTVAILTEKRLKDHENATKSQVKFHGVGSASSKPASSVQKFDGFISKA